MDKAKDTGKYLPVRIIGDFESQLEDLSKLHDRSKAATVRYCVKRVHQMDFPEKYQAKPN